MDRHRRIRAAVLGLGDAGYPQDDLQRIIRCARDAIARMDVDIVYERSIITDDDGIAAREDLRDRAVDVIVAHFASWHITPYVMHALKEHKDVPVLLWGTGGRTDAAGTLRSPASAAGITALAPLLKSMGYRYHIVLDQPDAPARLDEVGGFLKLCDAARQIRESRVGLVGYADMGLFTCAYDRQEVFAELGIDIEDYYVSEIMRRMDECPREEVERAKEEIRRTAHFQNEIADSLLDKCVRLYCALRWKADQRSLDAISIKCIYGVTKCMGINPCLAQSLLANKDLSVICECDAYGLLTLVILSKLTGRTSAFMEHYEAFNDALLVGVCGFIPSDFIDGQMELRATNLGESIKGISNVSKVRTGTVTYGRLYREDNRFKMFITRGEAQRPPKWTEIGWAEPTPDFPSLLIKLETPLQTYLDMVPGQHICMAYGDWKAELTELCGLLGIEAVCP